MDFPAMKPNKTHQRLLELEAIVARRGELLREAQNQIGRDPESEEHYAMLCDLVERIADELSAEAAQGAAE